MIQNPEPDSGVTVELTPIIDMVFLLLIFFLIATTFRQTEREMQIALPSAAAATPISSTLREIIVNVDVDGVVFVSGNKMEIDDLSSLINEAVGRNPDQKVTVRGDRGTSYANIVRVLDTCKSNGVREPYLDTAVTGAGGS